MDRSHGLDAITSERMLAGENVGPETLLRLLAAATAPPFPHETVGEDAAATAFRTARLRPVREGTPRPAAARRATLLGLKTAAAITVAVAAAGAALAAGTGVLPNPFDRPVPSTAPASNESGPGSSGTRTGGTSSGVGGTNTPNGPPATVPASMVGMCLAYQAQEERDPGTAASSPAFATLVAAAGGAEHVGDYCAAVLAQSGPQPQGQPSVLPTPPAHPTGPPQAPPGPGGQSAVSQPAGSGRR